MRNETLYRPILKEAWRITWQRRGLCGLGFLAIFWGGIGVYRSLDNAIGIAWLEWAQKLTRPEMITDWSSFSWGALAITAGIALMFLAATLGLLILATAARGGLVAAIARAKDHKRMAVLSALRQGIKKFWPLLGIGILMRLDVVLYVLLLSPLVYAEEAVWNIGLYIFGFVTLTMLSLFMSLLGMYSAAGVMLENQSLGVAIKSAVRLFREHWLVSIETALLLYALQMVVGIAIVVILGALGIPFALLALILGFLKVSGGVLLVLVPAVILYVGFLILAASIFLTFQYAVWTLLYLRLRSDGAVAKVVRATSRFAHVLHQHVL